MGSLEVVNSIGVGRVAGGPGAGSIHIYRIVLGYFCNNQKEINVPTGSGVQCPKPIVVIVINTAAVASSVAVAATGGPQWWW